MAHYVCVVRVQRQRSHDGRMLARGLDMDNARGVKFWVTPEAVEAYYADPDDDAHIVVEDEDITWLAKRDGGKDLWSYSGIVPSQERGA
jgi:hypothetical protein